MHAFLRRDTGLLAVLLALGFALAGCQTEAPVDPPTSQRASVVAKYSIKVAEPYKAADSATWSTSKAAGAGLKPKVDETTDKSIGYSVSLSLPEPLGGDTLRLGLWKNGVRVMWLAYLAKGNGEDLDLVDGGDRYDSAALRVLKGLDSAKATLPQNRLGSVTLYGEWALKADARAKGFPSIVPAGLSASEILDAALLQASKLPVPLVEQAKTWALGINADSARTLVLGLMVAKRIDAKDSATLFPPPVIRIKTAFSVAGPLNLGGEAVRLAGAFEWNGGLGLVGIRYAVLRGADTTKAISLVGYQSPGAGDREASFEGVSVQAAANATPGVYQLILEAQDGKGDKAVASVRIEVVAPLDGAGPQIAWISPSAKDTSLEFKDSALLVKLAVQDGSGVDSVWIGGEFASFKDGIWSRSVSIPVKDLGYAIAVKATDKRSNPSLDQGKAYRKAPPVAGAPKASLRSPANNSVVPFESPEVAMTWVIASPQGTIDSVTLDGVPAVKTDDSIWTAKAKLAATGKPQIVVLRARNSEGLWTTEVASLTRKADETGPQITWISPAVDLEVENGVASVTVRVKVADPSGVDTVRIAGQKPDSLNAAGEWVRKVPLTVVGAPLAIVVRAVDSAGNASTGSMSVTRQNPLADKPPSVALVAPAAKTGTVVPFETTSITVRWTITDPLGIDSSSVLVNGAKATPEGGDKWSASVALEATGTSTSILLSVKNKAGVSGGDMVSVTRQRDTALPVVAPVAGSRGVTFDSATVPVSWRVSDNDRIASVTIQGVEIAEVGGLYVGKVALSVGDDTVKLVATDRSGNVRASSVVVHRFQKMSLQKVSPAADTTVAAQVATWPVSWTVTGAKAVRIDEKDAPATAGTIVNVANLANGANLVRLVAVDSSGRADSSLVSIFRRSQVQLSLAYAMDTTKTLPDSVVIGVKSEAGAILSWSMDGITWSPLAGSFSQKTTGTVRVRAQMAEKTDSVATLKAFAIRHAGLVAKRGALRVKGNQVLDEAGLPIQIVGTSFGGAKSMERYGNALVVNTLASDWRCTAVRAVVDATADGGSYLAEQKRISVIVEAAIANGIYVVVGWRDEKIGYPKEALAFFGQMAKKYGGSPNVVFETGYGEVSWAEMKPSADQVVAAIRAYSKNLVIVATPPGAGGLEDPLQSPLLADNVVYGFGFSAGEDAKTLQEIGFAVLSKGLPLMVSEWATTDPAGGKFLPTESENWVVWMQDVALKGNPLSWLNSPLVDDKVGASSALLESASPNGYWADRDLSESGLMVRRWIRKFSIAP